MLAAVLGASAAGMLVAGTTAFLVQRERVDARIESALEQEVQELREFADTGLDPDTGRPFTSVERFFYVALQRNVPDRSEGLLALIDGRPALVPAGDLQVRLDQDPAFVQTVATAPVGEIRARTADTAIGSLRYVAVPVTVPGDPASGVYVIAHSRDIEHAEAVDAFRTFALVAAGAVVLIGGVAWAVVGRLLRPIRLLRQTAQRISDTDLSQRIPVTGRDDVSDLAKAANAMLDRLEAAFASQRDALDDAGHELRTPITIIRGHLELMDAHDPADVAETRALALDELDRMHRLVEDLVVLAKSRRPDFVTTRPVHVGQLLDDVFGKAQALADRQWHVDARADVVASLDEQRITQALLQLVSNAVKATGPADTVALGSAVVEGEVQLWVRDTGPGVPAEDAERIFERFARGRAGRGAEGSGLGLAIVRAIAEAHHGRVWLRSEPGRGADFTMALPLSRALDPVVEERR